MTDRPRVLIEDWLPIAQIGVESQRERGASSALPPLYFLHVWWARRPLTVSRAAILGSLLPAWNEEWPKELLQQFPDQERYNDWFLKLIGILEDPVSTRKALLKARETGENLGPDPYGYKRAFTYNPQEEKIRTLESLLQWTWGTTDPHVLDPMAGGGSIPLEALRFGFTTCANELNPVATVILKATLEYTARFGTKLIDQIRSYGDRFSKEMNNRLDTYFPVEQGKSIHAYLWARTIACPYTGKPIPLSPNWWLLKGSKPVAVVPIFDEDEPEARFEIVKGREACLQANPDDGTVSRGNGVSPWANHQAVDGDYIKAEAQAGRMGQQLYAVGLKKKGGFEFRPPSAADLEAVQAAEEALQAKLPEWEAKGLVPREPYPEKTTDKRPLHYGMPTWGDFFSPRQLLSLCTALEVFHEVSESIERDLAPGLAEAVKTYLALALDKAADYNSRMVRFHSGRGVIANTFDRHDFSFKWSHAEFDAAHNLFPWVIDQVADATQGLVKLIDPETQHVFQSSEVSLPVDRLRITLGSATSLDDIPDASIGAIVVDPPYYDNVQYAECSDFFYVWQKRSLGNTFPGFFADELTNKDDEAVANPARFEDMHKKKKVLAEEDYERKMEACFREMHRVLKGEGILTVMFTHKRVEAWDILGASLIQAGFAVHSSWPVHTESEHSLHQAKKNAAASTILLTCRKRIREGEPIWWDDLKGHVRELAREKAVEFEKLGIRGVDLYIATFGPVLSVISEHWPVLTSEVDPQTGQPRMLRPESALMIAREEVIRLRKKGLLLGQEVKFDPVTDWYLMAWDAFKAEEFPADEGRRLAIALGVELEDTLARAKKVVRKKSNMVVLQQPKDRRKRGSVDPEAETFDCTLDIAHTAMLVFEEDGSGACERWLLERGLRGDVRLRSLYQAMVNSMPNQRIKGKFVRREMQILDKMNDALRLEIKFPLEEAGEPVWVQPDTFTADENTE